MELSTLFYGMPITWWIFTLAKMVFILVVILHVAPIMAWVERRGSAVLQNRAGPNRVGPLGLLYSAADALKFMFKEDNVNEHVRPFYYSLAPLVSLVPAFLVMAVTPFAAPIMHEGVKYSFQLADLNVGILFIFAIASLGVFGIIMAGWAGNNKYAMLGGLRSSSQMISYELSMGLSVVGILMIYQTVELGPIVEAQARTLIQLGPISIPAWGMFLQPLAVFIFMTATYAECNRLPFDLPEGESEIVAGYHLEYGSMKFALFMMAEFGHMFAASALTASLFFGGYQLLPGMGWLLAQSGLTGLHFEMARAGLQLASLFAKVGFLMWLFVWVRWTLPRFRYDQVMDLGWKVMFPIALLNVFVTAILIYKGVL